MPDLLIDAGRLLYRRLTGRVPTGIDRVGLEYVRHYAGRARVALTWGPFSSVLSATDSARACRLLLDSTAPATATIAWLLFKAYLRWWTGPGISDCVLLNTSHTGLDNVNYARALRRRGARPVYFIHDLIPITHPQYCRAGERERHEKRIRTALSTGRGIIVNSRDTLEALKRFAEAQGLDMPPTAIAPLASSLPPVEPGPRPIDGPYFVIVSTIEPRKNHILLLRIWQRLAAERGGAAPRLVIIGHRGWNIEEETALLDDRPELRGIVMERGACSDRELVTYLTHAQALLFPSFVEGYGIPLAEALSLGTPAIASDLAVFREVAGEIPEYVDPSDKDRWLELIVDYARTGSVRRAAQLERIGDFRPATWKEHFNRVDQLLHSLDG